MRGNKWMNQCSYLNLNKKTGRQMLWIFFPGVASEPADKHLQKPIIFYSCPFKNQLNELTIRWFINLK